MPELPEIILRARELHTALCGHTFVAVETYQPKCLNLPPEVFSETLVGETLRSATHRGKWILARLDRHYLLLNLGMGGELLLHAPDEALPDKLQACFELDDGSRLSLHFWWFGYIHLAPEDRLSEHAMTARLGQDPLAPDFGVQELAELLAGRRVRIKQWLLDQSHVAGIGNMYAHDILFRARLHPDRPANSLTPDEVQALWCGMRETLQTAVDLGGARWERNLYNLPGGFDQQHLVVGYKEDQPCPVCGTPIAKIKTGSTAGFICPTCQPAP